MTIVQGWIAIIGAFATAVLGIVKYFNYRSRRDRMAAVGLSFGQLVESLASNDPIRQSAAAILLRRFFDPRSEQGVSGKTPYQGEAVGIIAALLRSLETSELQKLLADGLAYAPSLRGADLQRCNLVNAYLGTRRTPATQVHADHPVEPIDLSEADLFEADLSAASLKGARARGAVFLGTTLHGTVFVGADLSQADFRHADLDGARFSGARLAGAKFEGARNIPQDVKRVLDEDATVPATAGNIGS